MGPYRGAQAELCYNVAIAAAESPKGTLDCTTAYIKTDFRGDLKAFTIPTLVIHGCRPDRRAAVGADEEALSWFGVKTPSITPREQACRPCSGARYQLAENLRTATSTQA
jgi:hypothetical protein